MCVCVYVCLSVFVFVCVSVCMRVPSRKLMVGAFLKLFTLVVIFVRAFMNLDSIRDVGISLHRCALIRIVTKLRKSSLACPVFFERAVLIFGHAFLFSVAVKNRNLCLNLCKSCFFVIQTHRQT